MQRMLEAATRTNALGAAKVTILVAVEVIKAEAESESARRTFIIAGHVSVPRRTTVGVAVTAHTEGLRVKQPNHSIESPPVSQTAKVTRRSRALQPHRVVRTRDVRLRILHGMFLGNTFDMMCHGARRHRGGRESEATRPTSQLACI